MQKMTRRTFLKTAGAAALALVTGGGAWRAMDQGVFAAGAGSAYEPWDAWKGSPDEGALALVRAAVLAANPDNSQPWLFRAGASLVDVFADPARAALPGLRRAVEDVLL
ncbi:MAG: twin-arginine translocation signal domain-containing protein [Anaerolineae bacterium]|nr:twin-arginine translocation signal domain-containing protein [Anaerolineae bacterium]